MLGHSAPVGVNPIGMEYSSCTTAGAVRMVLRGVSAAIRASANIRTRETTEVSMSKSTICEQDEGA